MEISPRDLTMLKSYATKLWNIDDIDKAQNIGNKLTELCHKIEADAVQAYEIYVDDRWILVDDLDDGYATIVYEDGFKEEYSLEDVPVRVLEGTDSGVLYEDKFSHWEG